MALAKERNVEDITKINCFTAAEKTGCIPEAMTILLKYTIGEKKKKPSLCSSIYSQTSQWTPFLQGFTIESNRGAKYLKWQAYPLHISQRCCNKNQCTCTIQGECRTREFWCKMVMQYLNLLILGWSDSLLNWHLKFEVLFQELTHNIFHMAKVLPRVLNIALSNASLASSMWIWIL